MEKITENLRERKPTLFSTLPPLPEKHKGIVAKGSKPNGL
jgi:hypothetical protein